MTPRRIIILSGIVAIFIVGIILSNRAADLRESPISDTIEPTDDYDMRVESGASNTLPIESAVLPNQTGTQFYYENGKKHYIITAVDEPSVGD